jgi:hypothetical protein
MPQCTSERGDEPRTRTHPFWAGLLLPAKKMCSLSHLAADGSASEEAHVVDSDRTPSVTAVVLVDVQLAAAQHEGGEVPRETGHGRRDRGREEGEEVAGDAVGIEVKGEWHAVTRPQRRRSAAGRNWIWSWRRGGADRPERRRSSHLTETDRDPGEVRSKEWEWER